MVWMVVLDWVGGVDGVVPAGGVPGFGTAGDVCAGGFEGEDGVGVACSGAVGAVPTLTVDSGPAPTLGVETGAWLGLAGGGAWLVGGAVWPVGDGGVSAGGIACAWLGGDGDDWAGGTT
jgi:hypothetical protein